jgi:uncharacterized membrane protein YkvA (DUF1232 family)
MRTSKNSFQQGGAHTNIGPMDNLRLTWKLLRDPKVAPYAKVVLPILAIIYLISPIDLIPDVILGLGQMDDAGIIVFLGYLLVNLVRRAGLSTLLQETGRPRTTPHSSAGEQIIDATYHVVSDPGPKSSSRSKS